MTLKNKKKGFTLIELIVSIALIGILSIAFLSMFLTGFRFIKKAGNRSTASFDAQASTETAIQSRPASGASGNTNITFNLSDGTTINVEGKLQTQSKTINNTNVDITIFNPVN